MTVLGYRVPMVGSLLLWAVLWEIAGQLHLSFLLPPLSSVLVAMVQIVPTRTFMSAMWVTIYAFAIGNFIAIGVGVPLGLLMGRSVIVDRIFLPWVNVFLSAPLTALVPVIMVLFGLGQTTIILTVVLFSMWIIVLDTRAGVRSISPSLVEMASSFGASPWQAFRRIYFWAALPEILAGVRLGVIRSVKGVIIGQLLVTIVGFGALFQLYGSRFMMEEFWAALVILFGFAFLLAEGLARLERRVDYYAASRA
ncbi:MAG TPA: ABC transporter permease subunit [Devosiaceae bacterium]|nr:ABC transporter permease subunit [Devosiaceae bacterium]